MPSSTWNSPTGSPSQSSIVLSYDNISVSNGYGYLVNPRVSFNTRSGWSDSSNSVSASGTAVVDKQMHPDGTTSAQPLNSSRTWYLGAEAVPLDYGATRTATFAVTATNVAYFNGDANTNTHTWTITFPSRPYEKPKPPPTVTATKNSDTSTTVSWATDYTSANGPTPWEGVIVYRWDNVSNVWSRIVSLPWDVTSYNDTATVADRRYRWYVVSYNAGGSQRSTETYSGYVTTTPKAHTGVSAFKDNADIVVTWTINSSLTVSTRIEESTDGGSTWTVLNPAFTGNTWTHVAPSTTLTHRYRVTPTYNGVSGPSTQSNTVQLLTAPAMPSVVGPTSGTYVAAGTATTVTWKHNPLDGTAQTAYELQYRVNGGAWTNTNKITSSTPSYTIPAQTNGALVEWQVRTYGQHVNPSPWLSPVAGFTASTVPTMSITSPTANSVEPSSSVKLTVAFSGPAGLDKLAVRIISGGKTLSTETFTGTAATRTLAFVFQNNTTYSLQVTATDVRGLSAPMRSVTFSVAYVGPPKPNIALTDNVDAGTITVGIINPVPPVGVPATAYNQLFRSIDGESWTPVATLPSNGSYTDRTAPVAGTVYYMAVSESATPSYSESDVVSIFLSPERCAEYIWLSAGPDFSISGRFRGKPAVDILHERDKLLRKFAGRRDPVQFVGPNVTHELNVSGILEGSDPMSTEKVFTDIHDWPGIVLYRDAWGRRVFGSLGSLSFVQLPYGLRGFSTKLTRVHHVE